MCTEIKVVRATQKAPKSKITTIAQANAIDNPVIPRNPKDNKNQIIP